MESIFAPWRMEWVTRDGSADGQEFDCLFCDLPERGDDRENLVVARSEHSYVVLNNRPYNPGHVMTIPYDHTNDFAHLDDAVLVNCMRTTRQVAAALDAVLSPDGFNVGMNLGAAGGASITEHMHVHVIPRWASDTSFMPLTANTAIVEEAVGETYDRLHAELLDDEGTTATDDNAATLAVPSDG